MGVPLIRVVEHGREGIVGKRPQKDRPQKDRMRFFKRSLSLPSIKKKRLFRGPPGARVYAVGDIHGRLDLLDDLLGQIEREIAQGDVRESFLVFLGDLIDRGPDSAGVVERLRTWEFADAKPIFLMGNHEEVFLEIFNGEYKLLRQWLRFGGVECLQSYGIQPERLWSISETKAIELMASCISPSHLEFMRTMQDTFIFGDYLFVHAGIRPGVEISCQSKTDLRWIREPFLSSRKMHDFLIVHGHTRVPEVDERLNRIGIDTGAYASGRLTALVIEEDRRRYLRAEAAPG